MSGERLLWAEAVFHVLAHVVPRGLLPSSVYSPSYIAWAERLLGPARERELGDDARQLGTWLDDHTVLMHAQALAWLFAHHSRATACAERSLKELSESDVDRCNLLGSVLGCSPASDLLYCSALLELPRLARLSEPVPPPGFETSVATLVPAAPLLAQCEISWVRPLGLCGRVLGRAIWLGTPLDDEPAAPMHRAFQAAHEATVVEIQERARWQVSEREIEQVAIVRLFERARACGLGEEHAAFYSRLLDPPPTSRATLSSRLQHLLDR